MEHLTIPQAVKERPPEEEKGRDLWPSPAVERRAALDAIAERGRTTRAVHAAT